MVKKNHPKAISGKVTGRKDGELIGMRAIKDGTERL